MKNIQHIHDGAQDSRAQVVETLAKAFENDPALTWIFPNQRQRRRRLPHFFDWLFDDHLRHGIILASAACEAVTLWRLPGKVHHQDKLTLPSLWRMLTIFGPAIYRADRVGRNLAQHIPKGEGYLYLRYAAVHPDFQGQGLGGRVIRAGIEEANRLGVDVCLETAKRENVGIYQALGFVVVDEWQVPNGSQFWTMVRIRD